MSDKKILNKKWAKQSLILLLAVGICIASFMFNTWQVNKAMSESVIQSVEPPLFEVEVVEVQRQNHTLYTQSHGEVHSRNSLMLFSEVGGRVTEISENFEVGTTVEQGEILLHIDDTQYKLLLASAKAQVAQSHVSLLEEERLARQALAEWNISGMGANPESPLVLREPQLNAAQAVYEEALANLAKAQIDMENTRVRAPFDALIVEKSVGEGSLISAGTTIGTLESLDSAEVEMPLNSAQWQILPEDLSDIHVQIKDIETQEIWQATAIRRELHRNSETRQSSLIVHVPNPLEVGLFSGTFVEAHISGEERDDLMAIPVSAIFEGSFVWQVADNVLQKKQVHIVHYENKSAYIQAEDGQAISIVLRPSNRYFEGQTINPIVAESL